MWIMLYQAPYLLLYNSLIQLINGFMETEKKPTEALIFKRQRNLALELVKYKNVIMSIINIMNRCKVY